MSDADIVPTYPEDYVEPTTEEIVASILLSTKKALNIYPEETAFDPDLIIFINSVFSELHQLGVGPDTPFSITGSDELWSDFTTDPELAMVKAYMVIEVKLMFDPPTASLLSALERKRDEYEWRLNVAGDKLTEWSENQNGS